MVLRLLCGESLDAVSRAVGVEIYRLEEWKARALAGLELGLSAFLASRPMASRPALVRLASLFLIGSNVLFLLQYQLFMRGFTDIVAEYPNSFWAVFIERFVVPFRLVATWLNS